MEVEVKNILHEIIDHVAGSLEDYRLNHGLDRLLWEQRQDSTDVVFQEGLLLPECMKSAHPAKWPTEPKAFREFRRTRALCEHPLTILSPVNVEGELCHSAMQAKGSQPRILQLKSAGQTDASSCGYHAIFSCIQAVTAIHSLKRCQSREEVGAVIKRFEKNLCNLPAVLCLQEKCQAMLLEHAAALADQAWFPWTRADIESGLLERQYIQVILSHPMFPCALEGTAFLAVPDISPAVLRNNMLTLEDLVALQSRIEAFREQPDVNTLAVVFGSHDHWFAFVAQFQEGTRAGTSDGAAASTCDSGETGVDICFFDSLNIPIVDGWPVWRKYIPELAANAKTWHKDERTDQDGASDDDKDGTDKATKRRQKYVNDWTTHLKEASAALHILSDAISGRRSLVSRAAAESLAGFCDLFREATHIAIDENGCLPEEESGALQLEAVAHFCMQYVPIGQLRNQVVPRFALFRPFFNASERKRLSTLTMLLLDAVDSHLKDPTEVTSDAIQALDWSSLKTQLICLKSLL